MSLAVRAASVGTAALLALTTGCLSRSPVQPDTPLSAAATGSWAATATYDSSGVQHKLIVQFTVQTAPTSAAGVQSVRGTGRSAGDTTIAYVVDDTVSRFAINASDATVASLTLRLAADAAHHVDVECSIATGTTYLCAGAVKTASERVLPMLFERVRATD